MVKLFIVFFVLLIDFRGFFLHAIFYLMCAGWDLNPHILKDTGT